MKRIINKTAVSIVLSYVILTGGLRMFLLCSANSYNKLNEDKISPASLTVGSSSAHLEVLGMSFDLSLLTDSSTRICLAAYLFTPDELRAASVLASAISDMP